MKKYGFIIKCLDSLDLRDLDLEPQIAKDIFLEGATHFYSFIVKATDLKQACIKSRETKVFIEARTHREWAFDMEVSCEGQFYDLIEEDRF